LQSFGIIPGGEFYFFGSIGIHFSNDFGLFISVGFSLRDTNAHEGSDLLVVGFKEKHKILYE